MTGMPSLWPFARDDQSPASFEKALSRLSTQITSSTVSVEKTRTRAHRSKAFWTLWSTLAYIVYTIILALVLGPRQWSLPHYAGLAGAPIVIYGVRRVLALFFDWRIARQQGQLDRLGKEREQKISQLKKATRYDTTQELLNKYGGSTPRSQSGEKPGAKRKVTPSRPSGQQQQEGHWTGISPPSTANIPGRSPQAQQRGSRPSTPAQQSVNANTPPPTSRNARSPLSTSTFNNSPMSEVSPDEPGFAPNAFSDLPPASAYATEQNHRWYDRILDVMLGEDETLAKNRLALICSNCRLVNGQAPPGVRTLEEIGRWRCGSCGAWNGVEKVEQQVGRMVQEMTMKEEKEKDKADGGWTKVSRGDEDVPDSPELIDARALKEDEDDDDEAKATRSSRAAAAVKKVPDSAEEAEESDDADSGGEVASEPADESVADRVAKSKRASTTRARKQK
jgi:endoplasmic reticulum junction formation protein lunapark